MVIQWHEKDLVIGSELKIDIAKNEIIYPKNIIK